MARRKTRAPGGRELALTLESWVGSISIWCEYTERRSPKSLAVTPGSHRPNVVNGPGLCFGEVGDTGKESARAIPLDSALSPGGVRSRKICWRALLFRLSPTADTADVINTGARSAGLSHADSPNATRSPITSACSCRILPAGIEISALRRRASIPTFSAPVTTHRIRRERLSVG